MSEPDERTGGEQQEEYPGPRPDEEERPSGPSEHVPGSQKRFGISSGVIEVQSRTRFLRLG